MAIATILRRSASKLAPLAARFSGGPKNFHSLSTAVKSVAHTHVSGKVVIPASFSSLRHYSALPKKTSSDDSLLKVIESEIVCAEESDDSNEVMEVPENFPFKIEDNPGQQTISLSRKYQDETIEVQVHMPDLVTGEDDNENDDDDDDDEKPTQSHIPLVVRVNRNHKFILEFGCTAYPDEISIDSLSVRNPETTEDEIAYEGPDFSDLDENLQKAFHKYLEIRGIKPSTTNFLHEYMINKDSREYVTWLKNLKNFVQA